MLKLFEENKNSLWRRKKAAKKFSESSGSYSLSPVFYKE